jgi:general secretion pathway protein C
MAARWSAWIVWAALAASLVAWGLRLSGRSDPVPPHAETVVAAQAVQGDVLRLFAATHAASQSAAAAAPEAASRFRVLGVVAGLREGSPGWALIAVDGRAPRAVAVGAVVDGEWILQSVTQSQVAIGARGADAAVRLELPLLPPPATGTLAMAANDGGAAPAAVPLPPGLPRRAGAFASPAMVPAVPGVPGGVVAPPARLGVQATAQGEPIEPMPTDGAAPDRVRQVPH